jgi:hypothetical protein
MDSGLFRKRLAKVMLVIIINGLVFQVLLEVGLKFIMVPAWPTYFLPHHYPASTVQTTAGPVSASWTANSQGFHDVEHDLGAVANKVRIVTIGDSFLDGPQQNPLPSLLYSLIKEELDNVDVINLSRPGIDTNLYYLLFKHALLTYEPNIVLVFIYEGNDFRSMDKFSPDLYDKQISFFKRYPQPSYYGMIFPRSSIFFSDMVDGRLIHNRWSTIPTNTRWGKPIEAHNLEEISKDITKYIEVDNATVRQFLIEHLTEEELQELTTFGVRIDLLAYMISIGLEAKYTPRLGIKKHRPEIKKETVANNQVKSVFTFLKAMQEASLKREIEFYCVLIPTSYVDPKSSDMYARLGAAQDPLFVGTRMKQMAQLKHKLINGNLNVIDLSDALDGESDSYLKFDTHWNLKGVQISADYISKYLINKSKQLITPSS